jgi:histidinol-phosphate aminotransferase
MSNPYWSPVVHQLDPYIPGEQPAQTDLVKLNTNENPFGPSPRVIDAIRSAAGENLRLYPPPESDKLRGVIADYEGVSEDQVFVGNGSDEVLGHIFHAFFSGREHPLLFPDISYSFYPVYCGLYGIAYRKVPLAQDFAITLADYDQVNGGVIFPNPNAPTGMIVGLESIEALLRRNRDSVVVVDEAYIDFGGESAISLVPAFPNLVVVQTLSKSRSLAGLRVGFAIGDASLIEAVGRVKNSFNSYPLDQLAIAGAIAAFADEEYFRECRDAIVDNRDGLSAALVARGFEVLPSKANFVFARHGGFGGAELAAALRNHGVLVRHFDKPRISEFLRITIGTTAQHQRLLDALDRILG